MRIKRVKDKKILKKKNNVGNYRISLWIVFFSKVYFCYFFNIFFILYYLTCL